MARSIVHLSPHVGIKNCKRGAFMFYRHDTYVGRSLDFYGEWCDKEIELAELLIEPGDTVVDVGANIGTHTVAFGHMVGDGLVIGFEPQMPLYHMLCGNVAINFLSHKTLLYPYLCGGVAARARLPKMPEAVVEMNYAAISAKDAIMGGLVPVVPIDDLRLSSCKLIKIDVEGMEADVLRGAADTIMRLRPFLFVENNSVDRASEINKLVLSADYRAYWHIMPYFNPDNYFSNPINLWLNIRPEANLICVPTERSWTPELPQCLDVDDNWQKAWSRADHSLRRA